MFIYGFVRSFFSQTPENGAPEHNNFIKAMSVIQI